MNQPILPPLLNPQEAEKPYQSAIDGVRARSCGAGDVFWTLSRHQVEITIVLEPEVSSLRAAEMGPLAMVAAADSLAVLLPPQVAVQFRGGQQILVNAGVVGRIKTAMAAVEQDTQIPDWLVVSVKLGLRHDSNAGDPGLHPDVTALEEEGWDDPDGRKFIETFGRHFLSWMAIWNDDGFMPVSRAWRFKSESERDPDMAAIRKQIEFFDREGTDDQTA